MSKHGKRKRRKKSRISIAAFLFFVFLPILILIALILYYVFRLPVVKEVHHEAGTFLYMEEFLIDDKIEGMFVTDVKNIEISQLGEYDIQIQVMDEIYTSHLTIVDTLPPHGRVLTAETLEGILPEAETLVERVEDATDVTIYYKETPNVKIPRKVDTIIVLQDEGGNITELPTTITVLADTEPPVITGAVDLSVDEGMTLDYFMGVTVSDNIDANPGLEIDDSQVDLNQSGEYEATYIAADKEGNIAKETITVTVIADVQAPVIEGAQDIIVETGGTISYRKGITVTDDKDENPTLTIDNSQVDLETPGEYEVTYTATDRKGNSTSVTIIVTVKSLETLVMEEEVYTKAAEILGRITNENMTSMEKAFAIYRWTLTNIGYTGTSDKSDWIIGAYQAFKERSGDCFTYFAAAKALYTVAGIENVDIVKSNTSHSSHFWSIINLGDGWYHVDSTPRQGNDDNFFMVTDEELEAYSSKHYNSHIFDGTLYPERATESLQHLVNYSSGTLNR